MTQESNHANGEARVEFSFAITCFNEEQSIETFHRRLAAAMASTGRSYEIIYVNDGSGDATVDALHRIYEADAHVYAVFDLVKNVGQTNAVTAALAHCRGANVVFLDSDLQLEPEEFPKLLEEFDKGYDLVSGYRPRRRDSIVRRTVSRVANAVIRRMMPHDLSDFGCTFKIFRGEVIRAFGFGPRMPFHPAEVMASVTHCSEVPVRHHPREYNRSGWTWPRLLLYTLDNILGISPRPFQFMTALFLLLALGLGGFIFIVLLGGAGPAMPRVETWMLLLVLLLNMCFTSGLLLAISEFVIRNYGLLRRGPVYIIRRAWIRNTPFPGEEHAK